MRSYPVSVQRLARSCGTHRQTKILLLLYTEIFFLGPKLLEKLEPDNEKSDDIKLKEKHLEEGFTDLDKEK